MLNINDLESRWLHYKIKSFTPHIIIAASIMVIIAFAAFFFLTPHTEKKVLEDHQTDIAIKNEVVPETSSKVDKNSDSIKKIKMSQPENEVSKAKPKTETVKKESIETKKVLVSPSYSFIDDIKDDIKKEAEQKPAKEPVKKQIVKEEPVETEKIVQAPEPVIVKEKKPSIVIDVGKENTEEEIQSVIARFEKTNSPVLSLFVAKKYYDIGNYKMAYNYALKTNKIDSEIEKSWLIFAKSLVKLGQEDKAIKTLQEYVNHSHSDRAQILLNEIISGKMK